MSSQRSVRTIGAYMDRLENVFLGLFHQIRNFGKRLEEGEVGVGVEVGKRHGDGIIIEMKTIGKFGIDEAGRGPLAGPVSVAVFGLSCAMGTIAQLRNFPKGKDSKKMSEAEREKWFAVFAEEKKKGNVFFEQAFSSAKMIDKKGIVFAINSAMDSCLKKLEQSKAASPRSRILLDGALKAPVRFVYQKTIIKGDEKEILIACASIVAKVSRDRYMVKIGKKYPHYLFDVHKGYGTKKHREAMTAFGLSPLHRVTFCKKYGTLISNN